MKKREAIVLHERIVQGRPRLSGVGRFTTIKRAEKFIATTLMEKDKEGVEAGHYTIDASAQARAEYDRLMNNRTKGR